ncbi:MAG: hypothetical protein M3P49_17820, partial [Actinomycetota bacterium]|nr:hypothetical protein [Actinomycetota bacterium]
MKDNSGQGDTLHTFAPMYEVAMHATVGKATLSPRPDNVFREAKVDTSKHPTQKPVPLLQQIIQATTTDGELVADPFGGVASSLVAAAEIGRRSWGCELEGKYYALGEDRLNKHALEGVRPVLSLMTLGAPEFEDAAVVDARALAAVLADPIPGLPSVVWGWGEPPEVLLDSKEDENSQPAGEPEANGERAEAEAGIG